MMRALALAALLVGVGCAKPCRDGTILLTVDFAGLGAVDRLDVDSAGFHGSETIAPGATAGTVELDFPSGAYPRGQTLTLTVTAESQGVAIGAATLSVALKDACEAPPALAFVATDLGTSPSDGPVPDLAGSVTCVFDDPNSKFDDVCKFTL
jgi:hypothetical protein